MPAIPRERSLDSTIALMRDPYRFISKRCQAHGSDIFQTRILLRNTICMKGKAVAALIYNPELFMRRGAPPMAMQKTLLGRGGVQVTDDEEFQHRKRMLMSLMTPERVAALGSLSIDIWRLYARKWEHMDGVVELYSELQEILTRTVCGWAGVPLPESEVQMRTTDLTALFDQAGQTGPGHFRARAARRRAEEWTVRIIEQVRTLRLRPSEGSAVHLIAWYQDHKGELLDRQAAAVELLNVLRPTVAVSVYIVQEAHALHRHPRWRELIAQDSEKYIEPFVQEVRRYYPFFPFIAAIVRKDFEWEGYKFRRGTRVLLDIHGTNRDPREWEQPDNFRPERFLVRGWDAFNFIPQGGGNHLTGHRCPGEFITLELMKRAALFLAQELSYRVPRQVLALEMTRMPPVPRSRFLMTDVALRSPQEHLGPSFLRSFPIPARFPSVFRGLS